ncbi:hypothetical protein D9M72_457130 [compost metagenome]
MLTPPRPKVQTWPNTGSRWMPTTASTNGEGSIGSTSTPSICAGSQAFAPLAWISSYAAMAAPSEAMPSRTPPISVLCVMAALTIFMTALPLPALRKACAASAGERATMPPGVGMPAFSSSALVRASDRLAAASALLTSASGRHSRSNLAFHLPYSMKRWTASTALPTARIGISPPSIILRWPSPVRSLIQTGTIGVLVSSACTRTMLSASMAVVLPYSTGIGTSTRSVLGSLAVALRVA